MKKIYLKQKSLKQGVMLFVLFFFVVCLTPVNKASALSFDLSPLNIINSFMLQNDMPNVWNGTQDYLLKNTTSSPVDFTASSQDAWINLQICPVPLPPPPPPPPPPVGNSLLVTKIVYGGPMNSSNFNIFVSDSDNSAVPSNFPGSSSGTPVSVEEGKTYTILEGSTNPEFANYTATFSSDPNSDGGCVNTGSLNASATVSFPAGSTDLHKTCIITNRYNGYLGEKLYVEKIVSGSSTPAQNYTFNIIDRSTGLPFSGSPFSFDPSECSSVTNCKKLIYLPKGFYSVFEVGGTPTYNNNGNGDSGTCSNMNLPMGESSMCTITNVGICTGCSCNDSCGGGGSSESVTTEPPLVCTEFDPTKVATLNGGVSTPKSSIVSVGFKIFDQNGNFNMHTKPVVPAETSSFSFSLGVNEMQNQSFTAGVTYKYTACASHNGINYFCDDDKIDLVIPQSCIDRCVNNDPVVLTCDPVHTSASGTCAEINQSKTSATLHGNLVEAKDYPPHEHDAGVFFNIYNSDPRVNSSVQPILRSTIAPNTTEGSFSQSVSGGQINPGTYFFQACAINSCATTCDGIEEIIIEPQELCEDDNATNNGGALPCEYAEIWDEPIVQTAVTVVTTTALATTGATQIWTLFLVPFGFFKRRKEWGIVYNSVTKRPLDPVHLELINENGKVVATAITDFDGRYGFYVDPGIYMIRPNKKHYVFPSIKLGHVHRDEVYDHLYFGNYFELKKEGAVITRNIPMDPEDFDWWNDVEKYHDKYTTFWSKKVIWWGRVSDVLFGIGFALSLIAFVAFPNTYNIVVFGLFIVMLIIKELGITLSKLGTVVDKKTHEPLAYAIVRVHSSTLGNEVIRKVTDIRGKFYCLLPNGNYIVTIERKNSDGTYTKVLTTKPIEIKKGIIKGVWEV